MDDLSLDSIAGIRLYQREEGYRFSLDAVLLAGFTRVTRRIVSIADLGAGSGVTGLIIAKGTPWLKVTLIELQESLYTLALRNIELNGLKERVAALKADIMMIQSGLYQTLSSGCFDAVITNPPFRKTGTGRISPGEERAIARHEVRLDLKRLLGASAFLLKERGRLFMIYHPFRLSELIEAMREYSLEPKRIRFVHPRENKDANMVLLEAVKGGGVELHVEPPLIVYQRPVSGRDEREYTEEVETLLRGK